VRKAEPFAGIGAILLLVSLWLPWYDLHWAIPVSSGAGSGDDLPSVANAWNVLSVIDVLLALLALLMLAVPFTSLLTKGPAKAIGTALLASAFGWLAPVLVLFRLIDHIASPRYGIWLALAGSILAWLGSWFSLKDESTPGAVAPDVPRRPAPPAEPA
jgi:hypothetical protein